jgi:hypothetical protein
LLYSRFCIFLALLCAVLLPSPVGARPVTEPSVIKALATEAYLWGLGPQFIEQTSKYNTIIGAPFNALKYGSVPAAWNNDADHAGDASVLYVIGFVNFEETPELVLTVPPSRKQYYVVAYYDAYANTIGSIGTRTTPSDTMTSYLLVGPKSPYANKQTAKIHGYQYPVMASDTNVNWFVIRILTNTLIDPSNPIWGATSVPEVDKNVVQKFALNSLQEFEAHHHQPVYPASFDLPPPTLEQRIQAAPYKNAPKGAVDFFTQLGTAVATNPIPNRSTGLSGTPLKDLPPWVVPQYGAKTNYLVPSYGQKEILDLFAPLGLTKDGFRIPADWGIPQLHALHQGYEQGQSILNGFITDAGGNQDANFWGIVNDIVGTYPNDQLGYLFRSLIVVEGGVANVPLDGVYPTLTMYQPVTSNTPVLLDGDNTYTLTFTPPTNPPPPLASAVEGIYPPMESDIISGNPKGFWSVHVYATSSESNAPFIAQTSVLNTSYSTVDTSVLSVNAAADTMTVSAPNWGTLVESTPILFGGDATAYGLTPNTVYYVASRPIPNAEKTTYTFQISTQWVQDLSKDDNPPVPIQDSGNPGPVVDLLSPAGAGALMYGMVKPVTQLGSSQLAADQLAKNADGSLTLWFGPTLPPDAPASNWTPTPNMAYYNALYGKQVSTNFQLTLRMYFPTPGYQPPSILPCAPPQCTTVLHESYIPPPVVQVVQ